MTIKALKFVTAACLLLASAGAYPAFGDPSADDKDNWAADEAAGYTPDRPTGGHVHHRGARQPVQRMAESYPRQCGYSMRPQPFPTSSGYRYACVPWR